MELCGIWNANSQKNFMETHSKQLDSQKWYLFIESIKGISCYGISNTKSRH